MRYKLLAATAAVALASGLSPPAGATLMFAAAVNGTTVIQCSDNQAAGGLCPGDTNPAIGNLSLDNGTFAGIALSGSTQTSTGTPGHPGSPNVLNSSSLQITNTTGTAVTIQAAVGDTSFTARRRASTPRPRVQSSRASEVPSRTTSSMTQPTPRAPQLQPRLLVLTSTRSTSLRRYSLTPLRTTTQVQSRTSTRSA